MFGLSNREGNHGEDVKELYYYLDAVPTYSYARMLYKYPQAAFPYDLLVQENARRDRRQPEFEIIDTGIFDDDRYFDVDIEYAKAGADDILLRLTVTNRGPDEAAIHVLPQVWFRNTWSWFTDRPKPSLERAGDDVVVKHETLGAYAIHFDGPDEIKFCENETNAASCTAAKRPDVCTRTASTITWWTAPRTRSARTRAPRRPASTGGPLPAGASTTIRVRLSLGPPKPAPFDDFERIFGAAQGRGGCLLRRAAEQGAGRGPPPHSTPGVRGHPVVEAIFLLRRHGMARRRPGATQARQRPPQRTQQRVGPCHHGRRRLHAGQMGVSLVRGLGLGLSSGHARLSRSGGRQASADPARPILVHAPQRPAARLRMELQRRQSARAGLGRAAPLRDGAAAQGQGRPQVSRAGLHQAAAQLHLVGEPQGSARPQRLRRRLPWHGQYRRLRPVGAAAGRRHAGAVRRDVVDGDVQPEHAAHRHRAGAGRRRLSGYRDQVLRAFPDDRRGDDQPRRQGPEPVGRHRQFLLRLARHEQWRSDAAARSLPGRPDPGVRRRRRSMRPC